MSTIDSRMQQIYGLQHSLNEGLQDGTITSDEADADQQLIAQLTTEAKGVDDGSVTADQFDADRSAFAATLGSQRAEISSSDLFLQRLSTRIDYAVNSGALTDNEAAGLRAELASLGPTSSVEQLRDFAQLVQDTTRNADFDPQKTQANFMQRIDDGVADGSLSDSEAQGLRDQINAVDWTGDPASLQQARNYFNAEIYKERHNGVGAFDQRASFVQQEIDKLPDSQKADFQSQLDALVNAGSRGNRIGQLNELSASIMTQSIRNQLDLRV
jgi:hypothetical protein